MTKDIVVGVGHVVFNAFYTEGLRIEEGGDGTAPQPDPGAIVRGLLDRVAAIGGSLTVDRASAGVSVDAVVPI